MDALHEFDVIRPKSVAEMLAARKAHPTSRLIGGGTDILAHLGPHKNEDGRDHGQTFGMGKAA